MPGKSQSATVYKPTLLDYIRKRVRAVEPRDKLFWLISLAVAQNNRQGIEMGYVAISRGHVFRCPNKHVLAKDSMDIQMPGFYFQTVNQGRVL
jgi:hypothetical protein